MRFIIAYKLKRKNARRKITAKIDCINQTEAEKQFRSYCEMRTRTPEERPKQYELLTGDWKHITYFEGKE